MMMQLALKFRMRERILVVLCALSIICCSTIKAQQGFVSIDCGATMGYTDTNGLPWISDNDMHTIVGNATAVIPPPANAATQNTQFSTIRYFPGNQTKYCYVFNSKDHGVVQGNPYLIRALFWAGAALPYNTQVKDQVKFKLLISADEWDDVSIALPQTGSAEMKEIYVLAMKETIDVCLAGKSTGLDIPFISSLVLRPLSADMTSVVLMTNSARNRTLKYVQRINYGAPSADTFISYQGEGGGDQYDRIWQPDTREPILTTTSIVATSIMDHPPLRVMQTAYQSDDSFNLTFSVPSSQSYHFSVLYSEISTNVSMDGQRVFQLQVLNGSSSLFGSVMIDLFKLSNQTINGIYMSYSAYPLYVGIEGFVNFVFTKQTGSIYGPIICGLELLQVFDHDMSLGTDDDEVASLKNFTSTFPRLDSWSGDPCLPYAYNWLTCTNDRRPYIATISLENQGLGGRIPTGFNTFKALVQLSVAGNSFSGTIPDLSALQDLQVLDLHDNNLSGPIPDFLAELSALTTLNLENNNFSGQIPANLLSKASGSGFKLSIAGNPYLCDTNTNLEFCQTTSSSNEKKKGNGALVGGLAAVGAIAALVAIGVLVFCVRKHKKKTVVTARDIPKKSVNEESVLPQASIIGRTNQAQIFSYDSIKLMTRNFERMIGKGGFGPVYHGVLHNGKNVAVKLLSKDSHQGELEFLNEVELLSRVHHKNLVSLVGYCTEVQLVLVYEYMANGSLFDTLKGKQAMLAAWRDRLQIAVDAAEGLDYLHRGCNPSIIHRDVKSSNILLDEEFVGRISDFGISKSKQYNASTTGATQIYTAVQGSFGYLDPAYAETNIANHSIDVYAFGIVLFELITGKPPMIQEMGRPGEHQHILQWAKPQIERGDVSGLMDPNLMNDLNVSSMWKVIDVAMTCVEHDRRRRPNMNEIKLELQSALSIEVHNNLYDTGSTDHTATFIGTTNVAAR